MFFPEMSAARFVTLQCVQAQELPELQEIGDASGPLQRLIKGFVSARGTDISPKLFTQLGVFLYRILQAGGGPPHAALVPKQDPQLAVKRIKRATAVYRKQPVDPTADFILGPDKLRRIGRGPLPGLTSQIVRQRIWQNEIPIRQSLHQRAGPKSI